MPTSTGAMNVAFGDLFSFVAMDKELSQFYINKYFAFLILSL